MRRSAAVDEAVRLVREQGLSRSEAARRAGCTQSAVTKRFWNEAQRARDRAQNLARNDEKRAWENTMRAHCAACGAAMGAGSRRSDGSRRTSGDRCQQCRERDRTDRVLRMVALRVEEGLTNDQIAERVGSSRFTVITELHRMRVLGFEVPASPGNRGRPAKIGGAADRPALTLGRSLAERGIFPPIREAA
jgi:predicted DNA-binding protein (UPF0251 family)